MASERALLVIADIGGYTEYMRTHRMSLAHAEVNTARLLEAIIDAAGDFDLIEIEGDAAWEIIDGFAVKYTGAPYQDHTDRVVFLIEPEVVQSTA